MNVKRLISSIIVLTMCISVFAGCDSVKSAGEAIGDKASEVKDNFDNSPAGRGIRNPFTKSDIVFEPQTRFLYSMDGGTTWSETIQEVPIKSTYYLAIEMQISQSEQTNDEQVIVATITIPSTNVVDCYLDDHPGVSIHSSSYDITLSTSGLILLSSWSLCEPKMLSMIPIFYPLLSLFFIFLGSFLESVKRRSVSTLRINIAILDSGNSRGTDLC